MQNNRWMLRTGTAALLLSCLFLSSCATTTPGPDAAPFVPDADLLSRPYLYEVARHLYRWYMDEEDVERGVSTNEFVFWVRGVRPPLDEGDRSRFGEIVLPGLGIFVTVKKPDYAIEEYGVRVTGAVYKIVRVARHPVPRPMPPEYAEVKCSFADLREHLFRTRSDVRFPGEELARQMHFAVRENLDREAVEHPEEPSRGEQVVHVSPLSPVANELWVFWETGRLLIRFASDMDLEHPALWEHDELAVDLYDVDEQVVVSLEESSGSNAYLTRDQVGRALYNCVVLGKRTTLPPLEGEAAAGKESD